MKTTTPKQVAYLAKLGEDLKRVQLNGGERRNLDFHRGRWDAIKTDSDIAHEAIRDLVRIRDAARKRQSVQAPEGMHRFGGIIFKVQAAVHGSGRVYAKALVEDGDGWSFEYVPGAIRNLTEKTLLSLEDAKAFGALYGTCCVCGRTLTNESSIAEGIGPVCAEKF